MLSQLVSLYYSDAISPYSEWDEAWDAVASHNVTEILQTCFLHAQPYLPEKLVELLNAGYFHDKLLKKVVVSRKRKKGIAYLYLSSDNDFLLSFCGISKLSFHGNIIDENANYPGSYKNISIGQILSIWFDYQKQLKCIILLDNERYISIEAQSCSIE